LRSFNVDQWTMEVMPMLPNNWSSGIFVSPFEGLLRFRNELDRAFNRTWGNMGMERFHGAWSFSVDVYETPETYRYVFEVPGFSREDLDVTVENGVLTVTAERDLPSQEISEEEGRRFRHLERPYGRFTRSLRLPGNAILDQVDATCENGLLTVVLPKSAEARPRRIQIGSGEGRRQIAGTAA